MSKIVSNCYSSNNDYLSMIYLLIQSNISNKGTEGTELSVHIRGVSI